MGSLNNFPAFLVIATIMDFPVLIIGTGPSGATTALHLARLGVKSLVVSRHRGSANTPRAHIFNQRAMEVLRDAGIETILTPIASSAHGKFYLYYLVFELLSLFVCLISPRLYFTYIHRYAAYGLAPQSGRRRVWPAVGLGK
jgi:hypothetical protein